MDAIDQLTSTAASHQRIACRRGHGPSLATCPLMGRGGCADYVFTPEDPARAGRMTCGSTCACRRRRESIVLVAEGVRARSRR